MDLIESIKNSPWELIPRLSASNLERLIQLAADSYHNKGESIISDDVYDILVERLRTIKPGSPVLQSIGAPPKGRKVKLPHWMGSMDKIKTDEKALNKWLSTYKGPYVISDKLDGISCLLVMTDGVPKLYTRGDGTYGQDITPLFKLVNMSCDYLVKNKMSVVIRGELIMSKKKFEKHAKTMSNARNMVGGIVNSVKKTVSRHTTDVDFVTYEIINPVMKPSEQFDTLTKWKTNVVNHASFDKITMDFLVNTLRSFKAKSDYEIDGIIISNDKLYTRISGTNPPYSFAYKGTNESKNTIVRDVIWTPSKDGILVPRIQYDKVRLGQADLEFTSGFNARFIYDNGIGPGAVIKMVRSGDTIPHIIGIVKKVEPYFPQDVDYEWDGNSVNIIIDNADDNSTVKVKRLTKFLKNIGVENMSEGIVSKLVANGYDDVFMVISMEMDDFMAIDGFQKRLSTKLYNGIAEALKKINLLTLMKASNIFGRGFGDRKLKKILDEYPNIVAEYNKIDRDTWYDKITSVDGFEQTTTDQFLDQLPVFIKFYTRFLEYAPVASHKVKRTGQGFANQVVVFTGYRNITWEKAITEQGGRIAGTVSRNTTILVHAGDTSTAKYKKAVELGTTIMTVDEFANKYFNGKK